MSYNSIKLVDKVLTALNYGGSGTSLYTLYNTTQIVDLSEEKFSGTVKRSVTCSRCGKKFTARIDYRVMALIPPDLISKLLKDKTGKKVIRNVVLNATDTRLTMYLFGFCLIFWLILGLTSPGAYKLPITNERWIYICFASLSILMMSIFWLLYINKKKHVIDGYALININNQEKYDYWNSFDLSKKGIITSVFLEKVRTEESFLNVLGNSVHSLEIDDTNRSLDLSKEQIRMAKSPW